MTKRISLLFGIFLLLLGIVSTVSADLVVNSVPIGLTGNHGSTTSGVISIKYENSSQNLSSVTLSGVNLSFSPNNFQLINGETKNITVTASIPQYNPVETKTFNFLINGTNGTYVTGLSSSFNVQVNASASLSIPASVSISEDQNQTTVVITNNGNIQQTNVALSIANGSYFGFNVLDGPQTINAGSSYTYTVKVVKLTSSSTPGLVNHLMNITSSQSSLSGNLVVERSYCKYGEQGNSIRITSVDDDDDFEWEPLMDVELEVEVENRADSSVKAVVKMGLYDLTEREFVEFASGDDELEETVRISDDDDEVVKFNFKLPATISPDNEYKLYIKAYESGEEDSECNSWVVEDVKIDSDYEVIMDELELPSLFVCGATNVVSLRVHNLELGDEELMRVNLYSSDLGLNVYSDEFELDEGDDEYVSLEFTIPENKEAKTYKITFYAEYDYRESSDTFRDSESLETYTITVGGDKCKLKSSPSIGANLQANTETVVGKDLTVEITITNPSDLDSSNFIVALEGYSSWASSVDLDQSSFNLAPGESKKIIATFNPTRSGEQEFVVKAIYGSRVQEQRITISVDESNSWISKISNAIGIKGNTTFWLTIGIFVVVIMIILVLLVRFINSTKRE